MSLEEENGFSVVELAIVIAVLSIFSSVAIPAFNCVRRRAISTAAQETIRQIKEECETNYIYGIDKFTSANPDKYQISSTGSNSCSGGTVTLTPEDTNLYPTYLYKFADSELSYNFKGQTGTSFVVCNKLICGDGVIKKKINLEQDFVVKDSYFEKDCSAYVIVKGPSWNSAESNSQKLGGHLVTINNDEENNWIADTYKLFYPGLYIGLSDEKEEGKWIWSSGEEVEYKKWNKENIFNSPEPSGGAAHRENYGIMMLKWDLAQSHGKKIGEWHDSDYESNPDNSWFVNSHGLKGRGLAEIPICD